MIHVLQYTVTLVNSKYAESFILCRTRQCIYTLGSPSCVLFFNLWMRIRRYLENILVMSHPSVIIKA